MSCKLNLMIGVMFLLMPLGFAAKKPVGKVIEASGKAFISSGIKKKSAKAGLDVFSKDKVKTGADGKIVIKLNDGDVQTYGPKTFARISVKVAKDGKMTKKVSLFSGSAKCKVNPLGKNQSYTVKTPSAVAGVRGTEFEMTMDPETMTSCTITTEGTVWNAAPEDEGSLQQSLSNSKAAPGPAAGPVSDKIKVTNANNASVTTPDGQTMVTEFTPGQATGGLAQQLISGVQNGDAEQAMNDRFANFDQETAERLQALEERLLSIEEAQAAEILPTPPDRPDRD